MTSSPRRRSFALAASIATMAGGLAWTLLGPGCAHAPREAETDSTAYLEDSERAPASPPLGRTGDDVLREEIYKKHDWLKIVLPLHPVLPKLAIHKMVKYVETLPLEWDVKNRVIGRIRSPDFRHLVIPFISLLQDHYSAEADEARRSFRSYIKERRSSGDLTPGVEHTLFSFAEGEGKGAGFKLDARIAAQIVTLYDAIFLKTPSRTLGNRPSENRKLLAEAQPIVRRLLEEVKQAFSGADEVRSVIEALLKDGEKVEILTISVVRFVELQAFRHYEMFAKKVKRSEDLEAWLAAQLQAEASGGSGGKLWEYLEASLRGRRYAVHVVVDGLQGSLLEALSRPGQKSRLLSKVHQEHLEGLKLSTGKQESKPAPAQSVSFLKYASQNGYSSADFMAFASGLYAEHSPTIAKVGISSTPTISVRNLPIAMTGAPVTGPHSFGIPNFHYLDRPRDRAYYFWGNDALLFDEIMASGGMISPFDRLSGYSTMNCNAGFAGAAPFFYDALLNLGIGERQRDFGDILCLAELERRARAEKELQALRSELLSYRGKLGRLHLLNRRKARELAARIAQLEDDGLPQYLMYYNPWPDHFAHFKGPFSDEIISPTGEYNRLSYWLGRLTQVYRDAGVYDRTLVGMAGDHGLAPVHRVLNPEVEVFDRLARKYRFKIRKISSDEGEGPKLTHPWRPSSSRGYDAVVASTAGGNYMLDFFKDQGSGWAEQPVYSDLVKLRLVGGQTIDMIAAIAAQLSESLDYLAVRETRAGLGGGVTRITGTRKGARSDALIHRQGDKLYYELLGGSDLLDLRALSPYLAPPSDPSAFRELLATCLEKARKEDPSSWCSEAKWRNLASYTERPDSVSQLAHLFDTELAGTVNLFPKKGIGYNSRVPGRHAGESFHEKDAFVGFWGGVARSSGPRLRTAENGSVAPTLFHFLTGRDPAGERGFAYRSFAREVLR